MKKKKIDVRLQHYHICNDCTEKEVFTVIFYNNDDNVCVHCGSKNCDNLLSVRLRAETIIY